MKKAIIRVFSSDINLLGEIDLFNSLIFSKSYNDIESDFQLITEVTADNVELLKKDNLIMINNENDSVGIIRHVKIDLTEDGNEILLVKGFKVDNILNNRIVYISNSENETKFAGNSVDLIEKLLNENFIKPANENRQVDNLILELDKNLGDNILWNLESDQFVGDTIDRICKATNIGYDIYLDFNKRKLVFRLYRGEVLADKVVFDPQLDNIKNMRYTDSNIDYKNTLYMSSMNEDKVTVSEYNIDSRDKGIARLEGFYSRGELDPDEDHEDLVDRYFDNNKLVESIEGEITSSSLFTYKKDFDLGDIVTVRNRKWGISKDLRITNITDVYEDSPKMVFAFGEPQPTLAKKIKNYITNII